MCLGPSIDNVVVEDEYAVNKKKLAHRLSRYDLLFGVTQAESFFSFSAEDNQYGIEADRRNRLLRTFVRNTYQFHLQEILATIINEYTDWEKSVLHPINIRDETLEALSDGQYIAPLVKTAELHFNQMHSSYFYVFEYQTKASEFSQVSLLPTTSINSDSSMNAILQTRLIYSAMYQILKVMIMMDHWIHSIYSLY